ncbi:hypothetical protein P6B95_12335 [Streptomyces atratus]|uniref:hypothetical protein n=1 Tax=Streptomyces atratus TaxID=1893 RepID=UPI00167144A3|nr:hypothetical protein [Streptomyces atratus]WPW28077.1 hypothetical protein P6B95_12335 [Streptomyces atratus]GGT28814.1 hypothetical protein GCM10010207_30980 [Streptomyces atratus]
MDIDRDPEGRGVHLHHHGHVIPAGPDGVPDELRHDELRGVGHVALHAEFGQGLGGELTYRDLP